MGKNPYLQHAWGTSPEQKKKEKEYNHQYYLNNKEKWANSSSPRARQKNVTDDGVGVSRRGNGLNTGSVGTNQYDSSEVLDAVRKQKSSKAYENKRYKDMGIPEARRTRGTANNIASYNQTPSPSQIGTNAASSGRPAKKRMNSYNNYGMADNEMSKSYTKTPTSSQIESRKTVARNADRRAAASAARSNAAAESEMARLDASAAKIRKRNSSIERARAMAESEQARQNAASERYKDYEKSGLFKKQETDKREEAKRQAQYQNRQAEIKKAISKKNGIQTEINNISGTIKRLQQEDAKGNAVKINDLYKQLDTKKEAYRNMSAYIQSLNF